MKKMSFLALAGLLVTFPLIWFFAEGYARSQSIARLQKELGDMTEQRGQLLETELSQFRLLPMLLAEFPALQQATRHQVPSGLNDWLAQLAQEVGSPAIYVMNKSGITVASSNANGAESFVGMDFSDRSYFKSALHDGSGVQHGVGLLTHKASLFFAHRLADGVVALKYEFEPILALWQDSRSPLWIRSHQQELLIASHKALPEDYLIEQRPIFGTDLVLVQGIDPKGALQEAKHQAWLIALPSLLAAALLAGLIYWPFRQISLAKAQQRALQEAVEKATQSLRQEMAERALIDKTYRETREALAQANRLAALGQITAGLAHEINQPIATIRTLAENAQQHLAAGNLAKVTQNLTKTSQITAKIGAITAQMRHFAQKRSAQIGVVAMDEVISGANLILEQRLQPFGGPLQIAQKGLRLRGDLIAYEQVLVNLVQNALEALADHPQPKLRLSLHEGADFIELLLEDNGPGIAEALQDTLFTPFATAKPDGLGLGLAIARDLLRRLGGELSLAPSSLGGAGFVMRMKKDD